MECKRPRRAIVGELFGRWTVKRLYARVRSVWWGTMQCTGQNSKPALQFVVDPAYLSSPLELVRGETEARKHEH